MKKIKKQKEFTLSIDNAGGPIQLILMNDSKGSGLRLLGSKGSPYKTTIKSWKLNEEQLKDLIKEIKSVI